MKRIFLTTTSMLALSAIAAQAGDFNTVYVEQLGQGNDITALQIHDPNQGAVSNSNIIGRNEDPVRQEGSGNTMLLIQGKHSGGNDAMGIGGLGIDQSGSGNYMGLHQLAGANHINEVQQHGSGNTVAAVQSGGGSTVDVMHQYGDNNFGEVEQINSNGSIARLRQGTAADPLATNNSARIFQHAPGGSNVAVSFQNGDSNNLGLTQTGSNSLADSVQVGDLNETGIASLGDNMVASVTLLGSSNYVVLEQFVSDQNATIAYSGDGNRLIARQEVGSSNSIVVDISGNNNGARAFVVDRAADQITQLTAVPDGQNRILQSGNANSVSVTGLNADDNSFGLQQSGDESSIVGRFETNGGAGSTNGNDVAIHQGGNNNHVTFTVSGLGNSLGIAQ